MLINPGRQPNLENKSIKNYFELYNKLVVAIEPTSVRIFLNGYIQRMLIPFDLKHQVFFFFFLTQTQCKC